MAGAMGLATVLVNGGAAEAGVDTRPARPTGTWVLDVTLIELQRTEQSHYAFTSDGIVVHISNNGLIGLGAWRMGRARTFALSFREFILADDGTVEGELRIHLDCTLTSPDTLTAVGLARSFDLQGNPLPFTVRSTAVGRRFGLEG